MILHSSLFPQRFFVFTRGPLPPAVCSVSRQKMVSSWFLSLMALSCCVCGLELNVDHTSYQAAEKQSLTLDWTFTPKPDPSLKDLSVHCDMWSIDNKHSNLFFLDEGVESPPKDEEFSGRVQFDKDLLKEGRIRLHVSSLRTQDSGWYTCEVSINSEVSVDKCHLFVTEPLIHASAAVNETTILPVHMKTTLDTTHLQVDWKRGDIIVHVWKYGKEISPENPDYKHRVSFFEREISKGNVSLKLKQVTEKDAGNYTCTVRIDDEVVKKTKFIVSLDVNKGDDTDQHQNKIPSQNRSQIGIITVVVVVVVLVIISTVLWYKRSGSKNEFISVT